MEKRVGGKGEEEEKIGKEKKIESRVERQEKFGTSGGRNWAKSKG